MEQSKLTQREAEVLQLLSLGRTNKEIGAQIHRSVDTVKTHRLNLMRKLHAHNAAMLVRRGFEMGLVC